ncbi:MAG: alpha-amylase/4-alpha-glucanotransferase domain-containing protein, partial [Nitrospirota bacterium]
MSKVYLILSIHNHQPVGNFDHVIEDAYKKAYLPFLKMLALHPKLKLVLHYSGNLLVWLEKKHPEAIDMITALIRAGRVELLSGGFYEPVLCSLPEDDRVMQIREMTAYIKDMFGYTPRGMWLAERVWEPHMPKCISKAGIEYLPLDDYHFKLAGIDDRDLMGYHVTEENGFMIKVFPGSEELRYSIPFKDVDAVMSYLKEVSMTGGSPLLTLADDGEKFGVWPDTFSHCYKDGWLESFFSALEENSDWIETTTFSEYQERFYPVGMVYLPAASYREMGEWALPPDGALDYEYALNELKGLFGDKAKSFLRGGTWRSFFAKYPESNHIHKRMLQISRKVHEAAKKLKVKSGKLKVNPKSKLSTLNFQLSTLFHELWKGQCNDAYWHGIFGGLYLPHLRSSLYRHLLNAESMAEKLLGEDVSVEEGDFDCDGFRDICISRGDITAFFTEDSGA